MTKIFVLADTHNRLPEKVSILAQDAHEIWHLGDVCEESILDELRAVGPRVTIVRGNCDSNSDWPLIVDLVRGGIRFRLAHFPPEPRRFRGKMSMLSCTVTRMCHGTSVVEMFSS